MLSSDCFSLHLLVWLPGISGTKSNFFNFTKVQTLCTFFRPFRKMREEELAEGVQYWEENIVVDEDDRGSKKQQSTILLDDDDDDEVFLR